MIKIEVETMRESMVHAFSAQMLDLDKNFRIAMDDACQPQKVQAILTEAANSYIRQALEEETKSYFLHGDGRKVIAAKVKEKLDAQAW